MGDSSDVVTLLGSGNSLGAYVPAVQLSRLLALKGIRSEVCVLQTLYRDDIQAKVPMYVHDFELNEACDRAFAVGHHKVAIFQLEA